MSRWPFAITVMFHMTFSAIAIGLSVLLRVLDGMHWHTGRHAAHVFPTQPAKAEVAEGPRISRRRPTVR